MKTGRFHIQNKNGVEYITFPALEESEDIRHLFTTRKGGVSEGIYASMNLSFQRGDKKEDVMENYRRIAEIMGCEPGDFVCAAQTHTDHIRIVTEEDRGKGVTRKTDYSDVDGLITDVRGIVLAAFFADCVPIYFADDIQKVVGLAHSGYRGTLRKIGLKMVQTMEREFQCRPENIRAVIGPSICADCYEVGEEVAEEFGEVFPEIADRILKHGKRKGKYQLDLWETNRTILREAGITEEHLTVTDICTCCNPDELFSHRASKGKRGNLGAFLGLI